MTHIPGEIVIRDCRVENVARLIRYNLGDERWQQGKPLESLRMERIDASGLWRPIALNGGVVEYRGAWPLSFTMQDCSLAFTSAQPEIFSVANTHEISLTNVSISVPEGEPPLVRYWDESLTLALKNVTGVCAVSLPAETPWSCPMR